MQTATIVSIGTELTLGQSVDTNSAWLAAQLAALGIRTHSHRGIPDELSAIVAALRAAAAESDVVICTGGLGPTDDDLTRAALADAAGCALAEDAGALQQVRGFFERRNREMPDRNRIQAQIPTSGRALENTCGTAPGVAIKLDRAQVFALPGVPFEMKEMFTIAVAPLITKRAQAGVIRSRIIHTYGMPESDVGDALRDLMVRGQNPEVGTTAALGKISIRVNATANTPERSEALLGETEQIIRTRLGRYVYGRDNETLVDAIAPLLVNSNNALSIAESCTGGLLGKLLTDTPGSSAFFRGGVIAYSNALKQSLCGVPEALLIEHGAVSEPVAAALARGIADRTGADYGLAISGVAGPNGGTPDKPVGTICIGLAHQDDALARTLRFGEDSPRDVIRMRSALTALNWLRRHLLQQAGFETEPRGVR